ncbi:uncharacterized protein STEHIDRAFT_154200 [Stereum hirsutum FP-91666 SS1]|uniref:uncharacterized protein n=1 Tax=Stereum hirsutum (strain FP-91666) TaxID=721885 RepID=UPI000440E664|nr:uncharacterized protein STEHIDRAFT_154200 [Stereum hirsutum FP-91666 SS1]EIM90375.1 hypothetical protein STEHIDRAFT_154200 [Stereum hirsutum FP-91666 SS1]
MSISPSLQASARSAYRALYRASAVTFSGDAPVLTAFRQKMRNDTIQGRSLTDEKAYEENVKLAREIVDVLRKNIVQARKVDGASGRPDDETWKICITKDTELADNDTIKKAAAIPLEPSGRSLRRKEKQKEKQSEATTPPPPSPTAPRFYSQLKKAHKQRIIPELKESDLEENFVRGSGPGGQSVNKTENNVQLLHKPTGIRVTCHETRSLEQNRTIARKKLLNQLDQLANPGLSKSEMGRAKQAERERRQRRKQRKKASKAGTQSDESA